MREARADFELADQRNYDPVTAALQAHGGCVGTRSNESTQPTQAARVSECRLTALLSLDGLDVQPSRRSTVKLAYCVHVGVGGAKLLIDRQDCQPTSRSQPTSLMTGVAVFS